MEIEIYDYLTGIKINDKTGFISNKLIGCGRFLPCFKRDEI
ncbi:MAG: hypothetical protein ACHQIM_15215 [Sphingobacteriales bacterium]